MYGHGQRDCLLSELKTRIQNARLSAARAVSSDLILLYWDIGRAIVEKQELLNLGDSVVEVVAKDLQREFPAMVGFSPANIWRMRQFHTVYSSAAILAQAAREYEKGLSACLEQAVPERKKDQPATNRIQILAQAVRELAAAVPWGHHVLLLGRTKSPPELFYYLRASARFGWSRTTSLPAVL